MGKKRVYQVLVKSGLINSKKEAESLIKEGRIKIGSRLINSLNYFINPKKELLKIDNKPVKPKKEKIYLLFNKPKGVETKKQEIIKFLNLESSVKKTIFPVGRLDKNSEGLLILTNDGNLTDKILNPKRKLKKTYLIKTRNKLSNDDINKLRDGIEIQMEENGLFYIYKTLPCKINKIKSNNYKIKIIEGKKRQIKRMIESVGNKVITLKRIGIGKLKLNGIKEGCYKKVELKEIIDVIS